MPIARWTDDDGLDRSHGHEAPLFDKRMRFVFEQNPIEAEKDHHTDNRPNESTQVEHAVITDTQQFGENEKAHDRSSKAEQHRGEEPHLVASWHQQAADIAGHDAEDDRSDHVHSSPEGGAEGSPETRSVKRAGVSLTHSVGHEIRIRP
jgi:hypothetical protein